jgi:hypothetical protein
MNIDIELNLLTIFYNYDKTSFFSNHLIKLLTKFSSENNYKLLLFPDNNHFDKYKICLDILRDINKTNKDSQTPVKFIIVTNSIDLLLEFTNILRLSFTKSNNVSIYLKENNIDKSLILRTDQLAIYEIQKNNVVKIPSGCEGINSNRIKQYIEKSNNRYNTIQNIFENYSILSKEHFKLFNTD